MAAVRIEREWPGEETLRIVVTVDACYPDAVDEARAQAIRALREAMDVISLPEAETPDT